MLTNKIFWLKVIWGNFFSNNLNIMAHVALIIYGVFFAFKISDVINSSTIFFITSKWYLYISINLSLKSFDFDTFKISFIIWSLEKLFLSPMALILLCIYSSIMPWLSLLCFSIPLIKLDKDSLFKSLLYKSLNSLSLFFYINLLSSSLISASFCSIFFSSPFCLFNI